MGFLDYVTFKYGRSLDFNYLFCHNCFNRLSGGARLSSKVSFKVMYGFTNSKMFC